MRAIAHITVALAPLFLAGALPFIRVFKGGRLWPWFMVCWVSLVAWMFVFCLVIPMLASTFDPELGREIATRWVPEGPAVVAMIFMGWFPAAILVWCALLVRLFARRISN